MNKDKGIPEHCRQGPIQAAGRAKLVDNCKFGCNSVCPASNNTTLQATLSTSAFKGINIAIVNKTTWHFKANCD